MTTLESLPHLNDTFFQTFGAWFNCDLIDIENHSELLSLAGTWASDLSGKNQDLQGIGRDLGLLLANWTSKEAMPFIQVSNTDWLFDKQTEQLLLEILQQLAADLNHFIQRT